MINAEKMSKLTDSELNILVKNFYNDTFLVDQNACSSPKLVVWVKSKSKDARIKFWEKVSRKVSDYKLNNSLQFQKIYNFVCDALSKGKIKLTSKLHL